MKKLAIIIIICISILIVADLTTDLINTRKLAGNLDTKDKGYAIIPGENIAIADYNGKEWSFTSTCDKPYFIPSRTESEYEQFLNNLPSCIEKNNLCDIGKTSSTDINEIASYYADSRQGEKRCNRDNYITGVCNWGNVNGEYGCGGIWDSNLVSSKSYSWPLSGNDWTGFIYSGGNVPSLSGKFIYIITSDDTACYTLSSRSIYVTELPPQLCICDSAKNYVYDLTTDSCICDISKGLGFDGTSCSCDNSIGFYNNPDGECMVCNGNPDLEIVDNTCQCKSGFIWDSNSNTCLDCRQRTSTSQYTYISACGAYKYYDYINWGETTTTNRRYYKSVGAGNPNNKHGYLESPSLSSYDTNRYSYLKNPTITSYWTPADMCGAGGNNWYYDNTKTYIPDANAKFVCRKTNICYYSSDIELESNDGCLWCDSSKNLLPLDDGTTCGCDISINYAPDGLGGCELCMGTGMIATDSGCKCDTSINYAPDGLGGCELCMGTGMIATDSGCKCDTSINYAPDGLGSCEYCDPNIKNIIATDSGCSCNAPFEYDSNRDLCLDCYKV
jgi:hypothetical protein